MADIIVAVVFLGAFLAFGIWMIRWQFNQAERRIQEWALRLHYHIVEKEQANTAGTGPMTRSGNKQVMYRVTLLDRNGAKRRALVKVGSETMGVLSDEFVVEWDDSRK